MTRASLGLYLCFTSFLGAWLAACDSGTRIRSVVVAPEQAAIQGWEVNLSMEALDSLPMSCFREDVVVIRARAPMPRHIRWALAPGSPDELYLGQLRFVLGDAGSIQLPAMMHAHDGVFHAAHVKSQLASPGEEGTMERSEATLVLKSAHDQLRGTLHLLAMRGCKDDACAEPTLRCEVSLPLVGTRMNPELLAQAD